MIRLSNLLEFIQLIRYSWATQVWTACTGCTYACVCFFKLWESKMLRANCMHLIYAIWASADFGMGFVSWNQPLCGYWQTIWVYEESKVISGFSTEGWEGISVPNPYLPPFQLAIIQGSTVVLLDSHQDQAEFTFYCVLLTITCFHWTEGFIS